MDKKIESLFLLVSDLWERLATKGDFFALAV
jgi:hypothetical protein